MRRALNLLERELTGGGGSSNNNNNGSGMGGMSVKPPMFHCDTLDGDTSFAGRSRIQKTATVVLTNPDTLHCSILPRHKDHGRLLAGLRYIVVDEAHCYSGTFGAHTAMIVRRLLRLCHTLYGSRPRIIACR